MPYKIQVERQEPRTANDTYSERWTTIYEQLVNEINLVEIITAVNSKGE